jgi:hypothetical protein
MDVIDMIIERGGGKLAAAVGDKMQENGPDLAELPCGVFNEGQEFTGVCQNCGHSQEAHEFGHIENNGIQVTTDGQTSKLVEIYQTTPQLVPGLYVLRSSMSGLYLRHMKPFEIPPKVYGDCSKFSQRVLKTFSLLDRGMGVLLSGEKGTGKSMTAKIMAQQAMMKGIPVIIIDQPFAGTNVISFLDELPNRCMFFIDEWEKIYAKESNRTFFLGVLDGTCRSRHLWVMTTNTEKVGEFFISRPGRIRYHKKYEGLPEGYIRGIVSDHIQDPDLRDAVIRVAQGIYNISPDVLMAIIEETVLHKESPEKFMNFFNVSPESPSYDVEVTFSHVSVNVPREIIQVWSQLPPEIYRERTLAMQRCQEYINEVRREQDDDMDQLPVEAMMAAIKEDYAEVAPFVKHGVHEATREWCEPFRHESNGKMWVHIDHLHYGEYTTGVGGYTSRPSINFRIMSDQVKEIKRDGTTITVIAKNGDKIVARPAKRFLSKHSWDRKADPYAGID